MKQSNIAAEKQDEPQNTENTEINGEKISALTDALQHICSFLYSFFRVIYRNVYYIGIQTHRYSRRFFRRVRRKLVAPAMFMLSVLRLILLTIDRFALKTFHSSVDEIKYIKIEVKSVSENFEKAKKEGLLTFLAVLLYYIRKGLKRHKKLFKDAVNVLAPIAACIVLVCVMNYWKSATFALGVTYKNESLGYVTGENVYNDAVELAKSRIVDGNAAKQFDAAPTYTLKVVKSNQLSDSAAICDKLIESSDDVITDACGIYLNGSFLCAVKNESDADSVFNNILKGYKTSTPGERVDFVDNIKKVQGLYPVNTLWNIDELQKKVTSKAAAAKYYTVAKGDTVEGICAKFAMSGKEFLSLNPNLGDVIYYNNKVKVSTDVNFLRVQTTRTEQYTQDVAYNTVEVQNGNKYQGYKQVKVQGQNGKQQVTAMVTYVDGAETKRVQVGCKVLSAPVQEQIEVGTKKTSIYSNGVSYSITPTAGRFVWPAIGLHQISSPFGYRWRDFHTGMDITGSGAYGRVIVAADSGTVVSAGWHNGLGNRIVIDHGGGVETVYGHCSAILVSVGQRVSQGQQIGRVGSTGNSTGPHLHFEVHINGNAVNPAPYIGL